MAPGPDKRFDQVTARDLLTFYAEAGVDAALGEMPVDRFADVVPVPEPAAPQAAAPRPTPPKPAAMPVTVPATQAPPPPEEAIMAARAAARQAATLDE